MFLLPICLLLVADAGYSLLRWATGRQAVAGLLALILLPVPINALVRDPVPQRPEDLRPVLEYVQQHAQPGDAIWVYYGAGMAFRYYQHLLPVQAAVSTCDRSNPRGQLQQVDALRGQRRAWVVFTHTGANGRSDERTPLISYRDVIGERLDSFPRSFAPNAPSGLAAALLYRLDDPQRLAALTAATARVPTSGGTLWSCYGVMIYDPAQAPTARDAVIREAQRIGLR